MPRENEAEFRQIIKAARIGDDSKLPDGVPIDLFLNEYFCSPACYLAQKGESSAVEFLCVNGANTSFAAFGAILSDSDDLLDWIYRNFVVDDEFVAMAYAIRSYRLHEEMREVIAPTDNKANYKYNISHLLVNYPDHRDYIGGGIAYVGDKEQILDLIAGGHMTPQFAVVNAIDGGHVALAKEITARFNLNLNFGLIAAAFHGLNDYVHELLANGAEKQRAIESAAYGRRKTLVLSFIADDEDWLCAIDGATKSDDIRWIEDVARRSGLDIDTVVARILTHGFDMGVNERENWLIHSTYITLDHWKRGFVAADIPFEPMFFEHVGKYRLLIYSNHFGNLKFNFFQSEFILSKEVSLGVLVLLARAVLGRVHKVADKKYAHVPPLPTEMWLLILSFACGISNTEVTRLGKRVSILFARALDKPDSAEGKLVQSLAYSPAA